MRILEQRKRWANTLAIPRNAGFLADPNIQRRIFRSTSTTDSRASFLKVPVVMERCMEYVTKVLAQRTNTALMGPLSRKVSTHPALTLPLQDPIQITLYHFQIEKSLNANIQQINNDNDFLYLHPGTNVNKQSSAHACIHIHHISRPKNKLHGVMASAWEPGSSLATRI